jgi:arabinofuranosyltransferase
MFPSDRSSSSAWAWAAVLALALFLAWLLACVLHASRGEIADDAFITYSYARNLAEGHGLRFNPTDPEPTWGASSLLHTLVAAAALRVGAHPLIATRALSLATFVLLGGVFGWTAARIARTSSAVGVFAGLVVCGLWGLSHESETHLISGMDTLLFTLVHGLCVSWAALAVASPSRRWTLVGVVPLGLLVLARPEGVLLAFLYVAAVVWARRGSRSVVESAVECAPLAGLVALAAALVFVAQWSYFGQPHPNAYYVKVDSELFGASSAWFPGIETTGRFLALRWAPLLVLAAMLAAAARAPEEAVSQGLALLAPSTLVALAYSGAIHEMAGGFRYEYPQLAPLVFVLVLGATALQRRSSSQFAATLIAAGVIAPLLAGSTNPPLLTWLRHPRSLSTGWLREIPTDNALARLGRDLAETGLGQDATILLSGAGQVPYHSRWRAIDWIGLNCARFSGREQLSVEQMWSEIDALAPDVCFSILPPAAPGSSAPEEDANWRSDAVQQSLRGRGSALFKHWSPQRLAESFWREMVWLRERCEFAAAYKLGPAWGSDWWVLVYVRRDSPHRERVLDVLANSRRTDRNADLGAIFAFDPRQL